MRTQFADQGSSVLANMTDFILNKGVAHQLLWQQKLHLRSPQRNQDYTESLVETFKIYGREVWFRCHDLSFMMLT